MALSVVDFKLHLGEARVVMHRLDVFSRCFGRTGDGAVDSFVPHNDATSQPERLAELAMFLQKGFRILNPDIAVIEKDLEGRCNRG